MYILKSVKIDNFRGRSSKCINFYKDINFLIGENGSGKTTILKIILGLLTANIRSLFSLPFGSTEIKLCSFKDKRLADIIIIAKRKNDSLEFSYQRGLQELKTIKIDSEETSSFRERFSFHERKFLFYPERLKIENYALLNRKKIIDFEEFIKKFVSFDDLSVDRLSFNSLDVRRERERDNSIDTVLEDVIGELVVYFKDLSLKASQKDNLLKETYITSLLVPQHPQSIRTPLSANIMKEKLTNILRTLGLYKQQKELAEFLNTYSNEEKKCHLSPDSIRMKKIIDVYDEVEKMKEEIFYPREIFLQVLNKLLKNKRIEYSESKEHEESLSIQQEGSSLKPIQLSSGEKHLLILLGKTLLQKNSPRIFIADEPEISLHIQWQRELVKAIRMLNKNAQIIFATHSPEIVAGYSEKLHNLSEMK